MKLFKRKTIVQNDEWKFWDFYDEDDCYGLCFIDATYLDAKNQTGFWNEYYLKILIPESKQAIGKFVTLESNAELEKLEDELIQLLQANKVNCKQVYRSIYYGAKRLLFEVQDINDFEACLAKWEITLDEYKIDVIKEKPWTIYKEMLPDEYDWQQIGNRELCEVLLQNGSNPEKPHVLENTFFGSLEDLKKLEKELHDENGKTINCSNDVLEIAFESELDEDKIHSLTYFLMDKAKEFNCEYDGWSTAIVK